MNENMNIKAKKRDTSLDAIAGLLILHMITLHCVQNTIGQLGQYEIISSILMFFMPWFFFKNGMFINDKSTFNWKKDASRLIFRYWSCRWCFLLLHSKRRGVLEVCIEILL